ncbi:MAG: ATP-binding protein, partial [Cetobacterium sp.]
MLKNSFGALIINDGVESLKREIRRALPFTSVSIIGNSGIGKTHLIEKICEDEAFGIDEFVVLRLQGISSEDFRLPILNTVTKTKDGETFIEKEVEFAKMGVFKRIEDNPDKVFLLLLDEITRASRDVVPMLFSILERKSMDGKTLKNVRIITAFNYGGDYISNFDFSDDALRRRQIFMEYQPNKQDFINFIEDNNYHPIIQEVTEFMPLTHIVDHETHKELMQPTTFGSWSLLNSRWKTIEKENGYPMTYEDCKEDINMFGSFFFTDKTISELFNKLSLLEQLNTIDIQVEVIDKNGLEKGKIMLNKQGLEFEKNGKEKEI